MSTTSTASTTSAGSSATASAVMATMAAVATEDVPADAAAVATAAAASVSAASAGAVAVRRTPPPPRPGAPSRPGARRDSRRPGGPRPGPRTREAGPRSREAGPRPRDAAPPLPQAAARRRAAERMPHRWFADQLVLTLSGRRPVHALLGYALPAAYDRLAELAPQTPLRPAGPYRRGPEPQVRECGVYSPRRGVIEAFARIAAGERVRALAFRLERGPDARWRCAALDIGPSPAVWSRTT